MMAVCNYAEWGGTEDEGLNLGELEGIFPDNDFVDRMKHRLCKGTHRLFEGYCNAEIIRGNSNTRSAIGFR